MYSQRDAHFEASRQVAYGNLSNYVQQVCLFSAIPLISTIRLNPLNSLNADPGDSGSSVYCPPSQRS